MANSEEIVPVHHVSLCYLMKGKLLGWVSSTLCSKTALQGECIREIPDISEGSKIWTNVTITHQVFVLQIA